MEKTRNERGTLSRRELIGGIALAGAIAGVGGVLDVSEGVASPQEAAVGTGDGSQYGFLVNTGNCINCKKCVEACKLHNGAAGGAARRKVMPYTSDFGKTVYVSSGCMHCEEPACMRVCPAGAISKRADGIVVVNSDRCIGCKYCYQACPFSVPHYGENGMDKCDCCLGSGVQPGDQPYCVEACLFGGLRYGTLDELSALNHDTAHRVEASTKPAYLIL